MAGKIRRPHERLTLNVRNQSSRNGAKPRLIVVHSTEGQNIPHSIRDLEGLGSWFNNGSAEASSHVGVDSDGYSARFVPDDRKAWTQAFYNPVSLSIEFIGVATAGGWTASQYEKGAQYVAFWALAYDIPIRKGVVTKDGRIVRSGVIRHSDLGHLGGDHHDPGDRFDLARMNDRARTFRKDGW